MIGKRADLGRPYSPYRERWLSLPYHSCELVPFPAGEAACFKIDLLARDHSTNDLQGALREFKATSTASLAAKRPRVVSFGARDFTGNPPPFPAVYLDTMAPIVGNARNGARELTTTPWGFRFRQSSARRMSSMCEIANRLLVRLALYISPI